MQTFVAIPPFVFYLYGCYVVVLTFFANHGSILSKKPQFFSSKHNSQYALIGSAAYWQRKQRCIKTSSKPHNGQL